jgi:hypothetical protein
VWRISRSAPRRPARQRPRSEVSIVGHDAQLGHALRAAAATAPSSQSSRRRRQRSQAIASRRALRGTRRARGRPASSLKASSTNSVAQSAGSRLRLPQPAPSRRPRSFLPSARDYRSKRADQTRRR